MGKRFLTRILLSNAFAGIWLAVLLAPVLANSFGSGITAPCNDKVSSQCIADNWTHTVYLNYMSGSSIMYGPSATAVNHINGVRDVAVTLTIGTSRDVNVFQGSYGDSGYWAFTACADGAIHGGTDPAHWCRPQVVAYNMTHPTQWWTNSYSRIGVACHELAHTLGLCHRSSADASCMVDPPNESDETQLDGHDADHLNTQYYPY